MFCMSNNRSVKSTFNERLIWDCLFSLSSLFFSSLGGLSSTRSILPISSTLPILSSSSFIFTLSRELSKGLDKTKLIFKAQGFSINQYIFYLKGTVSVIKAPSHSHNLYLGSVHGCSVAPLESSSGVFFPDYWCPEDPKAFPCILHITCLILVSLVLLKPPEDQSGSTPVPVTCAVTGGPFPCRSPCSWPRRDCAPPRAVTELRGCR